MLSTFINFNHQPFCIRIVNVITFSILNFGFSNDIIYTFYCNRIDIAVVSDHIKVTQSFLRRKIAKMDGVRCVCGSLTIITYIVTLNFNISSIRWRIGKILAYMLKSQGANITIFARKDIDRAWSNIIGYKAIRISDDCVKKLHDLKFDYDIIFNTIPKQVMDEEFISKINNNALIIDLASSPYGIDDSLVKKYKLNYYHEPGIPGRYAPKSAGDIIGKTIINILEQENVL